jgi:hypothetical protein
MPRGHRYKWWEWKVGLLTLAAIFFGLGVLDFLDNRAFGIAVVAAAVAIAAVAIVIVGELVLRRRRADGGSTQS